jgi:hypothetical protein
MPHAVSPTPAPHRASRWVWLVGLLGLACGLATACRPPATDAPAPDNPAATPAWFADVTAESGLDFTHDPGPLDGSYFMPQIFGSGAALFDFDGDGLLDLYLLHNGGPGGARNKLLRGLPGGRFRDASAGSGLDFAGFCMGAAAADVNNDGRPDLVVTEYGRTRLFLNEGGGRFRELAAAESGIDNPAWGTAVSFLDYDRDGWLDLVVVNYLDLNPGLPCNSTAGQRDYCPPNAHRGTVTRLYHNRGRDAAGKWLGFEDRTEAAGLGGTPGPGLGVLCADLTGDGWPDVFVANDGRANHLWVNQRDGTFKEEALTRGLAYNAGGDAQANMGVACGDVDGDGLDDLFVTHLTHEQHSLWRQGPAGLFQDRAGQAGLTSGRWRGTGFGTVLADFDQDGALDLALVNGRVGRPGGPTVRFWDAYRERNQLFGNDGSGHFRDLSAANPALCGRGNVARGLAVGDLDGDGALDLVVTEVGGAARVLRNVAPSRGHWLLVRAVLGSPPRDAIGAVVRVAAGRRHWQRLVQPSQSFLCGNDPRAHFGLGTADRVESLEVMWPDGSCERFACPAVDRVVEVRRGQGQPAGAKEAGQP